MKYTEMSEKQLRELEASLTLAYDAYKNKGLKLDLSRGKPSAEQLDFTDPMMQMPVIVKSEAGLDCRNYGEPYGLPEMRAFFAELTGIPARNIIVGGNSSLNMMFDTLMRAMLFGVADSERPWCREQELKFLCPCPGYDRHFGVTERLGFKLIPVHMTESGPDMDEVEALVKNDPTVKGIWCVPKYSNPTGITFSDETVRRLAAMKTAAPDFRIMWDNAYFVHEIYGEGDFLLDIFEEARKCGNENRVFYFTSTSKITYPGGGVAMMAASDENLSMIKPIVATQTIGPDKLNQLRHIEFLRNAEGVREQMKRQASSIRPKFDLLLEALDLELRDTGIAEWSEPNGGYFVSLDVLDGCAKEVFRLAKEAGVTLTSVGATFPYGIDPKDANLRLAPTYPSLEDLRPAVDILILSVKLACVRKLLG